MLGFLVLSLGIVHLFLVAYVWRHTARYRNEGGSDDPPPPPEPRSPRPVMPPSLRRATRPPVRPSGRRVPVRGLRTPR